MNLFINEIQKKLNSPEFSDPAERYKLLEELKADQEKIYRERITLVEKITKLNHEEINMKNLENYLKKLEKIYNEAQYIYDVHTHKLLENSDKIYNSTLQEIDLFKEKLKTINYEFESENGLEELINKEIIPIVNKEKEERKEYLSKIIAFLEDYDEYTNNCSTSILNLFKEIGIKNDLHKKNLIENEKKYLLDIAKEADDDENNLLELEDELKKILEELKNAIHKDICDLNLKAVFDVMDQMENQYRGFFEIIDKLLSSHDKRLTDTFQEYEVNILSIFWIFTQQRVEEINKRRNEEAEFKSKLKEFEIALEEAKDQKNKKKTAAPKTVKKGETVPLLVSPRPIEKYDSPMKFNYLMEKNLTEMSHFLLRNIIQQKNEEEILKSKSDLKTEEKKEEKKEENKEEKKEEKKDEKNNKVDPKKAVIPDKNAKKPEPVIELPTLPDELKINPYDPVGKKIFISPLSMKKTKILFVNLSLNIRKKHVLMRIILAIFLQIF